MKITIDKHFTTLEKHSRTKEQCKEFKVVYTDNDLLRLFSEATDNLHLTVCKEIISCELSAFPGGYAETDETHYSVEIILKDWNAFYVIHFYISQSGEIRVNPVWSYNQWVQMWDVKKYVEA